MTSRRHVLLGMGTVATAWLTGCASGPQRSSDQTRTYCLKNIRSMRTICTPERIPSADVEAEAKHFESAPGLLTVFVVRWNWTDSVRPLLMTLDGSTQVGTLPKSLVRLRLTPGDHVVVCRDRSLCSRTSRSGRHGVGPFRRRQAPGPRAQRLPAVAPGSRAAGI